MIYQITGYHVGAKGPSEYAVNVSSEAEARAWAYQRGLTGERVTKVGAPAIPTGSTSTQSLGLICTNPTCTYRGEGEVPTWAAIVDTVLLVIVVVGLLVSIFGNSDVSVGNVGPGVSRSVARRCPRCRCKMKSATLAGA